MREELQLIRQALASKSTYALFLVFIGSGVLAGMPVWVLVPLALGLAVLSMVDLRHFILPDVLTLPGTLLGVAIAPWALGVGWQASLLGVVVGGGAFALLAGVFYWVRKKHGMGFGDIKLLALIGAWAGVAALLPTLLVASLTALLFLPLRRLFWGENMHDPIPFGPFLILGGWVSLLYEHVFWYWLLGGAG